MKLSLSTEWLFFHLWKKNPDTNTSCPGVFVADTIIYRWAQPYFWYFTTKDGQILRKTKERIFVDHIGEVFLRGTSSSGVCASYMQGSEKNKQRVIQQEKIEFEYFQKESFQNFLYQREKALNAVLQKFIEPKNSHNSMIKVSWSPQFCLLSRKTNINDIRNVKIPLDDRLVTFEGPEHLTQSDSISSPILSSDIEQICLNIVKHIQDVSGGNIQISRMILYFKIDEKNRLWLLFSSGIKIRQKFVNEEMIMEEGKSRTKHSKQDRIQSPLLVLSNRKDIPQTQTKFHNKVKNNQGFLSLMHHSASCYNCSLEHTELYEILLDQVIASYEAGILDEESKLVRNKLDQDIQNAKIKKDKSKEELSQQMEENEDDYYIEQSRNIPGIILKLWGKIDPEKYKQLKNNSSWVKFKIKVCMECYLKFTQTQVESKTEREAKEMQEHIKEQTKKQDWQIVQQQNKFQTLDGSKSGKVQQHQQTVEIKQTSDQFNNSSRQVQQKIIKPLMISSDAGTDNQFQQSTEREKDFLAFTDRHTKSQNELPQGFLTDRFPQLTTFEVKSPDINNNFPSKKVANVYRCKQGLKILPRCQSVANSLNSTNTTLKHETMMQSIQQLKFILENNDL